MMPACVCSVGGEWSVGEGANIVLALASFVVEERAPRRYKGCKVGKWALQYRAEDYSHTQTLNMISSSRRTAAHLTTAS